MPDRDPPEPGVPLAHLAAVGAAVLAGWAQQRRLGGWFVDDAAISFAYARALAAGDGLVAGAGGERVEGYSDPLWVGLLALAELLGVSAWDAAKPLGLAFGALAVVGVWAAARRLLAPGDPLALAAPFALALDPRFAVWSASGLENALFGALLAGGGWAFVAGRAGLVGLAFGGLALTRPEGVGYGAVAVAWSAVAHGRSAGWALLGVGAPFLAYEAFRVAYFAWPLPNTFYAKIGVFDRWDWEGRGWSQLRAWASAGPGWLLPLFALAVAGRSRSAAASLGLAGGALLAPWPLARVAVLAGLGAGLPLLARPGVGLFAHLAAFGLFFSVYANGDWMAGFRWMSLVAAPLAVLLAVGLREGVELVRARLGDPERDGRVAWAGLVVLVGGLAPLGSAGTAASLAAPVDWPEMIDRRRAYTDGIADRLGVERFQVSTLEMDMGAHLWWSEYRLVDLAGLVDVPIARHGLADRAFLRAYVFEETRPLFAHVHRHWARISGIPSFPEWRRDYVELPPYDDGGRPHDGVFVRRDALLRPSWDGPPVDLDFGGLRLLGVRVRSPEADDRVLVELAWAAGPGASRPVVALRAGGEPVDAPPAYGWVPPDQWRGAVAVSRVEVPVGQGGALRVRVLDGSIPRVPAGAEAVDGWVALPAGAVRVPDAAPYAEADRAEAERLAAGGRCPEAEAAWADARAHLPDPAWVDRALPGIRGAIARCWVSGPETSARDVARARSWDARDAGVIAAGVRVAGPLRESARRAAEAGDHAAAFRAYSEVLAAMPWDAWSRRHAEAHRGR